MGWGGEQNNTATSTVSSRSGRFPGALHQHGGNQPTTGRAVFAPRSSRHSTQVVPAVLAEEDEQRMDVSTNLPVASKPALNYAFAARQPPIIGHANNITASRNSAAASRVSTYLAPNPNTLVSSNRNPARHPSNHASALSVTQGPRSANRGPQNITFGRSYEGLSIDDFKVGMVFKAAHYVEMMDKTVAPGDPSRIESRVGICSAKERHMILINKLGSQGLLVLTVGSKSARGLGCIRDEQRKHYMTIEHPSGPEPPVRGPNQPIEVTEWGANKLLTPESFVSLLEPYLVCCRQDVFIEGMISLKSYELIVKLFKERMQFGFESFPYGT